MICNRCSSENTEGAERCQACGYWLKKQTLHPLHCLIIIVTALGILTTYILMVYPYRPPILAYLLTYIGLIVFGVFNIALLLIGVKLTNMSNGKYMMKPPWSYVLNIAVIASILLGFAGEVVIRNSDGVRLARCRANLKNLGNAIRMYNSNNNERMPLKENWTEAIECLVQDKSAFSCPTLPKKEYAYGFNSNASGVDIALFDDINIVLLFYADGGKNKFGGMENLALRHLFTTGSSVANVLLTNNQVLTYNPGDVNSDIIWTIKTK